MKGHVPRSVNGLAIALLAGFFWGGGNAVASYATKRVPEITTAGALEIAICNYIGGAILLAAYALTRRSRPREFLQCLTPTIFAASAFKTLNALTFVIALFFVTATFASTIENSHVLITATLAVIAGATLPARRLAGAALTMGGILALSWGQLTGAGSERFLMGAALALAAALSYAMFLVFWGHASKQVAKPEAPASSIQTVVMIVLVLVALLTARAVLWLVDPTPIWIWVRIDVAALLIFAGMFSIGLTYFLVNLAFARSSDEVLPAAAVVSAGVAVSVLMTFVMEALFVQRGWNSTNAISVLLFAFGYFLLSRSDHTQKATERG